MVLRVSTAPNTPLLPVSVTDVSDGAVARCSQPTSYLAVQLFSYAAIWLKQYRTGSVVMADLSAMTWICPSAYKRP